MRILLADNEPKVRFALRVLLERQPDISVVGDVINEADLLSQIDETQPDIVLLDWGLPGLATLSQIRARFPSLSVIVLSGRPETRQKALSAGADAFVSKINPPEELLAAISQFCCTCR